MNIYDLISRAQKLRKETQLDSVSPDRVGGLHEDTLKYINEFQLLASSPSLHKAYASVSAMQSDKSPKSDLTGKPLKPGQLVVIVPANQTDATAGDVYRYDGPSGNTSAWTFVAKIGAVPADAELSATSTNPPQNKAVTEKLTELESQVIYDVSANNDGATFDSLSALLSSENLSALIPTAVRCGGMSIRFVQSSDNKYVQYRLKKNTWSIVLSDWEMFNEDPNVIAISGKYSVNNIVFTSDDVSVGTIIEYEFNVQTQLGGIELYNSSDEMLADYGKSNSGTAFGIYCGVFSIPEGFSYAKIYANGDKSYFDIVYLKKNSNIVSELYKVTGVLAERGNYTTGTILFDTNDVSIGDTINYELNVQTQIGCIVLYDSSDEMLAQYGKDSSATAFGLYKGAFVIPEGFSYAKVYAAGNKGNYDIEYLVDFTLCNSQIDALNTRVDNVETSQTGVKGKQDAFIAKMGYLCYEETYNVNANLFTSDDIIEGNLLRYDLYAHSSTGLGYIGFYDAGNNEIGSFGKTASGATGQNYTGIFEVPIGFSYAKAVGTDKITVTISCNGFEQKQDILSGKKVVLKDRVTTYNASGKHYVSFSSGVVFNGKEIHVSRVSQSHYSDYEDGVFVFQEITESGEVRNIYPELDYDNLTGYIRDPNIVVIGDYLVLATAMSDPQTRVTVANYLFVLDSDYNVVYSTEMGVSGYTFGNTLLTPEGKLLRCTYTEDNAVIKLYRSNEVFNTKNLTFTLVNTISHEDTELYEPTIGYVKDKLVLVVRTSSLSTGLICASSELEGNGEFGAWNELGINLHAATIEPYNDDYKVLIAGGEFGANYKRPPVVIKWDVENSILLAKGVVDENMTVSGSYPSFVNVGGDTYAMVYYEDYNNTAVYTYLYYKRVNTKYLFNH